MRRLCMFSFLILMVSACSNDDEGSKLKDLFGYPRGVGFRSLPSDADPELTLKGEFGSNSAESRNYAGGSRDGNFVLGPYKSIPAVRGFMRAGARIQANFFKPYIPNPGTLCVPCPMYAPASGSFKVDFVYRKPGQDFANPTVVGTHTIALSGWNEPANIEVGSTDFTGSVNQLEVRISEIRAESIAEIKVFETKIDVGWQP